MKTILITGVSGFIGRNISRHYFSKGWQVIGVSSEPVENSPINNLSQYYSLHLPEEAFQTILLNNKVDIMVHCAGKASVPFSVDFPFDDYKSGPFLTCYLLEQLRNHSPKTKFIFLSSAAVYGNPTSLPVSEETSAKPISPYGFHKLQSEILCQEYFQIYNIFTASLRIFSAYGPGLKRQVIWDICNKLKFNDEVVLHGTGNESRDFIHILDIVSAIDSVIHHSPMESDIYNLGSGEEITVKELTNLLQVSLKESNTPIKFNQENHEGMPKNWKSDISKLNNIGFQPQISIHDGLNFYSDWFLNETSS